MISSFKVKKLKRKPQIKLPNSLPSQTYEDFQQVDKPSKEDPIFSFRQYCFNKYNDEPYSDLHISRQSFEDIGNAIIKNEVQDWDLTESKGISKRTTPFQTKMPDTVSIRQPPPTFITEKPDVKILPKSSIPQNASQIPENAKKYKRLQVVNYIKDVIADTRQVREDAEEKAKQIFGKGSLWRRFDQPQYFSHPAQGGVIFTDLRHLDDQLKELNDIYHQSKNVLTPQTETTLTFANWTKRNLGSVHSRQRAVSQNRNYAIQDFRVDEISRYVSRQTRKPSTSYQPVRDVFKLDKSIDYFMQKAKMKKK